VIDFENPEVRETIGKVAAETGMSLEEIIKKYEYAEKHKTYVRFTKGVGKGKVGYYFPSLELFPYSRNVYCPDGSIVVTMGWDSSFDVISEEEYLKECEVSVDDSF
jgi:hypothetical protein